MAKSHSDWLPWSCSHAILLDTLHQQPPLLVHRICLLGPRLSGTICTATHSKIRVLRRFWKGLWGRESAKSSTVSEGVLRRGFSEGVF